MTLSITEKERYSRHLLVKDFGEERQEKLKSARVLIIGAGGLGCPVIQYLVAAGVGNIGIVDGDVVSLSNLQRQILYAEEEIGQSKAEIAAAKMTKLNGSVNIHIYNRYLTDDFAAQLFPEYDVVVGCTDNYNSRYIIDVNSKRFDVPFVHGSICEFEGQFCVFNYKDGCSYSDLFGTQPAEPTKSIGVIGAIPGIIGSLMAMEVLKIATGMGTVSANRLLLYNALDNSFNQLAI
jgi:molybdopterin/thiamine biosynthesis adenylyltransferase